MPDPFLIQVLDAVIRAKLLSALHTAELNKSTLSRLDTLQLKGLRKILRMETTFVNRANTNERVFERANAACRVDATARKIRPFSDVYREWKIRLYEQILQLDPEDPVRGATLNEDTLTDKRFERSRVGRPRLKWAAETQRDFWKSTSSQRSPELRNVDCDATIQSHRIALLQARLGARDA